MKFEGACGSLYMFKQLTKSNDLVKYTYVAIKQHQFEEVRLYSQVYPYFQRAKYLI